MDASVTLEGLVESELYSKILQIFISRLRHMLSVMNSNKVKAEDRLLQPTSGARNYEIGKLINLNGIFSHCIHWTDLGHLCVHAFMLYKKERFSSIKLNSKTQFTFHSRETFSRLNTKPIFCSFE
jgi:hypothetical protein